MRVPIADLKAQYASITDDIDAAVSRVIGHCGFILGPERRVDREDKQQGRQPRHQRNSHEASFFSLLPGRYRPRARCTEWLWLYHSACSSVKERLDRFNPLVLVSKDGIVHVSKRFLT